MVVEQPDVAGEVVEWFLIVAFGGFAVIFVLAKLIELLRDIASRIVWLCTAPKPVAPAPLPVVVVHPAKPNYAFWNLYPPPPFEAPPLIELTAPPPKKAKKKNKKPKRPKEPPRGTPVRRYPGNRSWVPKTFHLDECAGGMSPLLRREGIDHTTTHGVGLIEASDSEQLRFATGERRMLVTFDTDFKALARQMHHSGILFCEGGPTRANQIEMLRHILKLCREASES